MHIAHFSDTCRPQVNGVVSYLTSLNRELIREGHSPYIIGPGTKDTLTEVEGVPAYTFKGLLFPPYPEYSLALPQLNKVMRIVSGLETNVLHAHSPFSIGMTALYLKKVLKLPMVGTFHTLYPDYLNYLVGTNMYRLFKPLLKDSAWKFLKSYYSQCDRVIAPSHWVAAEMRKSGLKNYVVMPSGIDTNKFTTHADGNKFRRDYKLKGKFILSLSRIGREKNIELTVDAAIATGAQLVIAGKGPYLPELKHYVEEKKMGKQAKYVGYLPDFAVPEAYKAAEFFVTASHSETQGLTVLEAMGCGKPVVVFKGATSEFVIHGRNGFVAETDKEFIDYVRLLWQSPETVRKMSAAARKTAEEHSLAAHAGKLLALYSSLA